MKHNLAETSKDVIPCKDVPKDVKRIMLVSCRKICLRSIHSSKMKEFWRSMKKEKRKARG